MPVYKPPIRNTTERNAIVEANQRFVWKIALEFMPSSLGLDELVSAGMLGLIRAAELWDPNMGAFTTIARSHIRKTIHDTILQIANVLAIGRHGYAAAMGYGPCGEFEASRAARRVLDSHRFSLNEPGADGFAVAKRDSANREDREEVEVLLGHLPERESRVLRLRFGLDGEGERTRVEIGRMLGVTGERIRQIETSALKRLRDIASDRSRPRPPHAPIVCNPSL